MTATLSLKRVPASQEIQYIEKCCTSELNMTSLSEWQNWVGSARGSGGFCTLTPASIQIKYWQKAVGVWSRAPLIKQWSWLLQEAAISHWSLGTVWTSHKGLCLSMSIIVCTPSYSGAGSQRLYKSSLAPFVLLFYQKKKESKHKQQREVKLLNWKKKKSHIHWNKNTF